MAVLPRTAATTTDADPAPTGIAAMIAISEGKAAGLHAFPEGFIPPNFFPGYVPERKGNLIFWLSIVMCTIALIVVSGRLISRQKTLGWFGIDDWMIIPAMAFCIFYTAITCVAAKKGGLGTHSWDMEYKEAVIGVKILFPNMLLYTVSIFFTKISIIFFIYRLVGSVCSKRMRYTIYAYFTWHVSFTIALFCMFAFQCLPVRAGYDINLRFDKNTHCKNYAEAFYTTSALHAISDVFLIVLPVKMVWGLQMPPQKKIAVIIMFSLGGLACLCSILRMVYIWNFSTSYDLGWDSIYPSTFGIFEANLALITASLPSLRPFLAHYTPGLISSMVKSDNRRSAKVIRGGDGELKVRRAPFMDMLRIGSLLQTRYSTTDDTQCSTLVEEEAKLPRRPRSRSDPGVHHQCSHETLAGSENTADDASSQKRIMKTMSVHLSYEIRPNPYRPRHYM